jgi:5-formyltetrahydrofolate cyclo-ligase
MSLESDKAQLRERMLLDCRAIDPEQAAKSARRVAEVVAGCSEFATSGRMGLFASIGGEISTGPVYEAAQRAGKRCLFPRCRGKSRLEFVEIDDWAQLEPGRMGILEPPLRLAASNLCENDLLLVPGVAFDLQGGRLGRGGGFYDRAFAEPSPKCPYLMGFGFPVQLIAAVPLGAHDRRLDAIATESGIVRRVSSADWADRA